MKKLSRISKEKYIEIIEKIKLNGMYLKSCSCVIDRDHIFKEKAVGHIIRLQDEPSMVIKDDETVDILHKYSLEILSKEKDEKSLGKIECTFCLNYSPASCFSLEFFEEYKKANLHINTWPFFREFVFNMTARMNVPPITLPLLKAKKRK